MSQTQCPIISLTYWLGGRWAGLSAHWFPWHAKFWRDVLESVLNDFPDMLTLGEISRTQCLGISLTCWLGGRYTGLSAQIFPWHADLGGDEPDSVPNDIPDMLNSGEMSRTQCPEISLTCWLWVRRAGLSAQRFPWHADLGGDEPDSVPSDFPDMHTWGKMSRTKWTVILLTCWLGGRWAGP